MMEKHSDRKLDLPVALGNRMGHDTRAMDTFFGLDEERRQQVIRYVQSAQDGADAKSRVEHTMRLLSEGGIEQLF